MKRIPWDFILALLLGLGLGLAYSWIISPLRLTDSEPTALRADFKDQFRSVIAASYASTDNLPRAQVRLALLGDIQPIEALNAQAQRNLSSGQFAQADQLAALAFALENGTNFQPQNTPILDNIETATVEPAESPFPSPADLPLVLTETPQTIETQVEASQPVPNTPAPRPTQTPIPTQSAPFKLIGQDIVCDSNLPTALLQVFTFNASRRQIPGIKIVITWDSGREEFFTGLKPELGNGYADFLMEPGIAYSIQLANGSDIAANLVPPTCQASNGEPFLGGYKLTFQQP